MSRLLCILAALSLAGAPALCASPQTSSAPPPPRQSDFSRWAAIVVAGEDHASHADTLTETFDNARRDVAAGFVERGFSPANLAQFSLRPERYPDTRPARTDTQPIFERLDGLARQAADGCLVYFSSHGSRDGVAVGETLLAPKRMAQLIDAACGARPTAVILSACFSGVFVPRLRGPNRFILTAARSNRASFGCGASDKYPFFDACVIEMLPVALDFIDLGPRVQGCVAKREDEQDMRPRSEPQLFVGDDFRAAAPPFSQPAARTP